LIVNTFGSFLRAARVKAKKSAREVAEAIGVSHVFYGEVERGTRPPFKQDRWPAVVEAIPGLTLEDLEHYAARSKPVQLSIKDAPPRYQDLSLALARRINERDLTERQLDELFNVLGKDKDDDK
jgi:transcriptional regulator with XRE-family HTH domain